MTPNISRYIDESILKDPRSPIAEIGILLNGFHCAIHYGPSGAIALRGYGRAANESRVQVWQCALPPSRCINLADITAFEQALAPAIGRVIAGTTAVWDGTKHVASITNDGRVASAEVTQLIGDFRGAAVASYMLSDAAPLPDHIVVDRDWVTRMTAHGETMPLGLPPPRAPSLVSVIIGVFNKASFVEECLRSVLSQDVSDVELICIDDASTDGSAEILAGLAAADGRIRLIRNERNLGAGRTRNIGLAAAAGDYVMFLDADDMLAPHALSRLLKAAQATGSEVVRGGIAFYHAGSPTALRIVDTPPDRSGYRVVQEPHLWIAWWFTTYLYRRSFVSEHQIGFPELNDGEDPVFLAEVLTRATSISSISETVYYYRKHSGHTRDDRAFLAHLPLVKRHFDRVDPRLWRDGYGRFVLYHDLTERVRRAGPLEARISLRDAVLALDVYPHEQARLALAAAVGA